ncbi:metal ABC transporter permease [Oceanomicrobium pacificus]|uniref:High-affinity zinc uptake system membrane protein ZnuB n=1 Tax=Oceanomicrobium pacificus TaxID=2692916 RepID=A0A6B0TS08_9RHOB|nr:metal ABC transporter permease [Oceanomicrobium pacificus]MXU66766.1 hypothetical protein [Oceanomicrobium pacificus]
MFDDFLFRAAVAVTGLALAAGPMGCFVVWRRMAYFGDATAHAAILGVALSLALAMPIWLGVLVMALLMALFVSKLSGRTFAIDTMLGVAAHSALAFGLLAAALIGSVRLDLMAFLFGDVLAVSVKDLAVIWGGAALVLGLLAWRWRPLILATLNRDLATAHGIDPRREQLVLTLALAVLVAVAIKVVGALLITALLLIPAAAARALTRGPEAMAVVAVIVAALSGWLGLGLSLTADTPAGPSIVAAAAVLFSLAALVGTRLSRIAGPPMSERL